MICVSGIWCAIPRAVVAQDAPAATGDGGQARAGGRPGRLEVALPERHERARPPAHVAGGGYVGVVRSEQPARCQGTDVVGTVGRRLLP